ncbi:GNAT family N-acetyltransferase [Neolewinella lacunae]|uniref:GNAT family N-acetyltransferase n=1 Tax=Neolewinella lacunae TaxID=1517758 RepID=A0A923PS38_9BACT|nr:GNAT family N-acetyltransferase [Neolewinella lacunae]MBC6996453.1 GNAT family N-acetyltransferase [Neolewinella lacunae]MDN3633604.1 GNAT family N-acetyltransferase [Neolewinella lacunae]
MHLRVATLADIPQIQLVRNSVTENMLSNPDLVTDADCAEYLSTRGRGWVAEIGGEIVGFSIVDLHENNVWALFLKPEYSGRGIGRQLHEVMLDWYFHQTTLPIWLGTEPGTRAEQFYQKAGWEETGVHGKGEIKFTMRHGAWAERVGRR